MPSHRRVKAQLASDLLAHSIYGKGWPACQGSRAPLLTQVLEAQRRRRHRLASTQAPDSSRQLQSVLMGGDADAAAFMSDIRPVSNEDLRAQEAAGVAMGQVCEQTLWPHGQPKHALPPGL